MIQERKYTTCEKQSIALLAFMCVYHERKEWRGFKGEEHNFVQIRA